jgi:outer membrane protein insertion porin family
MLPALLICSCLAHAAPAASTLPEVHSIVVEGNRRIPTATVMHYISARPGAGLEVLRVQEDIRRLGKLGVFSQVEISARPCNDGKVDLVYRLRERPWVSGFDVEAQDPGLAGGIREHLHSKGLDFPIAAPFDPARGREAESAARQWLHDRKYPCAEVGVRTENAGDTVRVRLAVRTGPRMAIEGVEFAGNAGIPDSELLKQLESSRPAPQWSFWTRSGIYSRESANSDAERLRRYYLSRGYAEASVGRPQILARQVEGGRSWSLVGLGRSRPGLWMVFPIVEGPRFRLRSVGVEGDARAAAAEARELVGAIQVPAWYDLSHLEAARRQIEDALGRQGYALAQVRLIQDFDREGRVARAVYRIDAGDPVLIGRIRFTGNRRLPDKFLRRELRVQEGRLFDSHGLDESLAELNRSGLIEPVRRTDLDLEYDEAGNSMDIAVHVRERDRNGVYGTGGTGGSAGSYLGIVYRALNVLGLGEILTLELDGGAAQSNCLLNLAGRHFFGAPAGLAFSAFHRVTRVNVAQVVPDAGDLYSLFRRRSAGFEVAGTWAVTSKAKLALGIGHERVALASPGLAAEGSGEPQAHTTLTPGLLLDATRGTGFDTRGFRLALSQSLTGNAWLTRLHSSAQSFRLQGYAGDPWNGNRRLLALQFQAGRVRPAGKAPLTPDLRLFPGNEVVRGFGPGALSAWELAPDPTPAGADTLIGFSSEYRVPLAGPVGGAAFLDAGWSSLSSRTRCSSRVLEASNGIPRASVGGELRLQLPLVHQPARLIFAWNPLRLDKEVRSGSGAIRLADPRKAIRFALGNPY